MIEVGDKAPDVRLVLTDGKTVSLADYRGQPLVVYFYPKDDTSGCTREAQDFTARAADFEKAKVAVVGVSKDSLVSHDKFSAKYALKVSLASDGDGGVCEAFGVWVEKSLYGRKYMGIERATFLMGRDGRIARIWRKVKVAGHAEAVLEAVKSIA